MMGLHAPEIAVVMFTNNALYCRIVCTADSADLSSICIHLIDLHTSFIINLMRESKETKSSKEELWWSCLSPALGQSCQSGNVTGIGAAVSVNMCNGCKWLCCIHWAWTPLAPALSWQAPFCHKHSSEKNQASWSVSLNALWTTQRISTLWVL